jgi:hypothetical protein
MRHALHRTLLLVSKLFGVRRLDPASSSATITVSNAELQASPDIRERANLILFFKSFAGVLRYGGLFKPTSIVSALAGMILGGSSNSELCTTRP